MVKLNGSDTLLLEQPNYIGSFDMNINNVQVYPNPMAGKCNLKYFSKSRDDLTISIYDLGMKLLISKEWEVEQGTHIFDIKGLKSGVYILTVRNGKEVFTQRLVSTSALEGAIDIKYSSYESVDIVNKSLKSLITLDYNVGDTILFEGYSGSLPTVLRTLIVNEDIEVKFNFKTQAIEGSDNICQGTQQTYSVESITGVMYTWSYSGSGFNIISGQGTSSIVVEFSDVATLGNLIVTPRSSCGDLQSKTKSITVNSLPTVTVSASLSTVCGGGSSILTASGASTYSWSHILGTGASKTVTPSATTTYTVTGTSSAGCTNTATITVTSIPSVTYYGDTYNTVQIGSQCWMKENLRTIKYNDNIPIANITDASTWVNLNYGAYCCYSNNSLNCYLYGALYNWYAVNTGKLCPAGWHVPSDAEWTTLTTYLGGESVAGGKMKETGTTYWNSPNTGATNESGFSGLPGGCRLNSDGSFTYMHVYGYWWSSTEYDVYTSWYRSLYYNHTSVSRYTIGKNYAFSVRCIKD
jgi:uncharacterized protein (TIGR02145 family)